MNHQHVISFPDGTAGDVTLNEPQHRAYQALRPGATVALPWGRGVGLSWFTRFAWYTLVAEHDYRPRKEAPPPWPRGVRIVHLLTDAKGFRADAFDRIEHELCYGWGALGGRLSRSNMCITFAGGSRVDFVTEVRMRDPELQRWRADMITCDDADSLNVKRYDALVTPLFSHPWGARIELLGGIPHNAPCGLLSRAAKDPRAVTIPATYRDVPEAVDPVYVEQLRATMAPDVFAREWECQAA